MSNIELPPAATMVEAEVTPIQEVPLYTSVDPFVEL
jgi:hypothetical protein